VLQALARDKVVTLHKNRGAIVSQPTVKEAREVFAARRLIEVALAREVVRAIDDKGLAALKAHIVKEDRAEKTRNPTVEVHTSHEFHTLLADTLGNSVISQYIRELMARSALITAVYERPDAHVCSHISHGRLIELIEKKDPDGLAASMLQHLDEIEGCLVLREKKATAVDLKDIFAGY
jgi:DNA-binding GntR family transcriptional regulator